MKIKISRLILTLGLLSGMAAALNAQSPARGQTKNPVPKKCAGSSPKEIISSYNRTWGTIPDDRGIGLQESCAILSKLIDYSAACGVPLNPDSYSKMPWDYSAMKQKATFNFMWFLSGQHEDPAACVEYYLAEFRNPGVMSQKEFCRISRAAPGNGGLSWMCPALSKSAAASQQSAKFMSACRKKLPATAADCGNDSKCSDTLALFQALKAGRTNACPNAYMPLCANAPIAARTERQCSVATMRLEDTYCDLYAIAYKRTGGQIGRADADMRATAEMNKKIQALRRKSAAPETNQ